VFVFLAAGINGCAGSWTLVDPDLPQKYEGRVVEVVELNDGHVVFFDPFDSAGPGPDMRARVHGESIEGTMLGAPRIINMKDVKKVQFGVEEKEGVPHLVHGVLFVAGLAVVILISTVEFTAR
jgi:hypothetical protein